MGDNLGREFVVMFQGICGDDWDKTCISRPCTVNIYADGIDIKDIKGIDGCEYGQEFEFKSFSQVTVECKKKETKFLFFRVKKNILSMSVDYTPVGGAIEYISSIIVNDYDAKRIMDRYNFCKQNATALTIENNEVIESIKSMNGIKFEKFLGELFNRMGYRIKFTKTTGDQGVDLLAYKNNECIAIQAKCYNSKVGNSAVQEVIAGRHFYNCSKSVVVTNNYFTNSAIELANSTGTILWDRDKLNEMIKLLY